MSHSDDITRVASTETRERGRQRDRASTPHRDLGQPYLQLENIHKKFGDFVALRDIYLDVYPGEFVCLLGPSGCGKTTMLRIIAGLEEQTSGRVIQDGKDVSNFPAAKRDFGIVFQSYALFPNLTAAKNIAYGLENAKESQQKIKQRVADLLDMVGLPDMGNKYPAQLSGGQQQRVALARALALSPGLLLLDEPLSALDAKVRVRLRNEISQLQKRLGVTTVMVTHDQEEALAMGDRIVVMNQGYIAQSGTPHAIYQQPNTSFVADFIGVMNFIPGVVEGMGRVRCGNLVIEVPQKGIGDRERVKIAIRPEDIVALQADGSEINLPNVLRAKVEDSEFLGSSYLVTLTPEGDAKSLLTVNLPIQEARRLDLNQTATLKIQLPPESIQIFPADAIGDN